MNRQRWMAALICVIIPSVPAAGQEGREVGENDLLADTASLSGTTFDVSLFPACDWLVSLDMATASFEFGEADAESTALLTGPATVTLTDQSSPTAWTGQWCALDLGSAMLWLLSASASDDRLMAFGVQFDTLLVGRAHASGALAGSFHLFGQPADSGVPGERPGQPPGEGPDGEPPEEPVDEGDTEADQGEDPAGRPPGPTEGEIPGPRSPDPTSPGPGNRADVRRFR